jgi:hypothetical protein
MRVTALDALASAKPGEADALLEAAASAASRYVAGHARLRLAARDGP